MKEHRRLRTPKHTDPSEKHVFTDPYKSDYQGDAQQKQHEVGKCISNS